MEQIAPPRHQSAEAPGGRGSAADTGTWGVLATVIFVGTGLAFLVLLVRLVRRRRQPRAISSTLGLGVLVVALALAALIGADLVTAEPQFCNC